MRLTNSHRGCEGWIVIHGLWAWKHYSTYKLVWKSMNSNREIFIITYRVIIECVALLYSRILLFADGHSSPLHSLWV